MARRCSPSKACALLRVGATTPSNERYEPNLASASGLLRTCAAAAMNSNTLACRATQLLQMKQRRLFKPPSGSSPPPINCLARCPSSRDNTWLITRRGHWAGRGRGGRGRR